MGGAIANNSSTFYIGDSIFEFNGAQFGGCIANYVTFGIIENCSFVRNTVDFDGAAIRNNSCSALIKSCMFKSNLAFDGGGAIANRGISSPLIEHCKFIENVAFSLGGAAQNETDSTPFFSNCVFKGNMAAYGSGGAINSDSGSPNITNCVFAENEAQYPGGAISSYYESNPHVANSIFYNNKAPSNNDIFNEEIRVDVKYSRIENYSGIGNFMDDPLFIDVSGDNFHLRSDSPCRDTGDPSVLSYDINGTRNDIGVFGGPGTTQAEYDGDYDGMGDSWEKRWGLNPNDPSDSALNPDSDYYNNLSEFNNETNPLFFTPRIIYVNDDATGAKTGLSWDDAFTNLNDAIEAASRDSMIWVAEGLYNRLVDNSDSIVTMKEHVDMYGGFLGTESTLAEREDPALHPTVLDGEDRSLHVVKGAPHALIDGFIITRGISSVTGRDYYGGGMWNYIVKDITVSNCAIIENDATNSGGIYNYFAGSIIGNCEFKKNYGAGIANSYSQSEISHCVFVGNKGPGIANMLALDNTKISYCFFSNNHASYGGGISDYYYSRSTVENSVFIGNTATGIGGAIASSDASHPLVINCTFLGNLDQGTANTLGVDDARLTVVNSIIWGDCGNAGSQIEDDLQSVEYVSYSDIEGASSGTANIEADPMFEYVPNFWDETVANGGWDTIEVRDATLYNVGDIIEIENDRKSRMVEESSGTTVKFYPSWPYPTTAEITIENWGPVSENNYHIDEDLHLQSGSPCINAGASIDGLNDDFDGNPRPFGLYFDMGSYEYQVD